MGITKIQWTDATWNPVRGCSLVSAGCTNCYAMKQAHRFSGPGQPYEGLTRLAERGPIWTGKVRLMPEVLDQPLRWKKPRRIFVNSMSDLFHPDVPTQFIDRMLEVMEACDGQGGRPRHIFQVLTKRPELIEEKLYGVTEKHPFRVLGGGDYLRNLWLGVSCENQKTADKRIPLLFRATAAVYFVSLEPLLEPIGIAKWLYPALDGTRLNWVIVGGESGPKARPCNIEWIRDIVRQCKETRVPCFVKQLGSWAYDDPPGFVGGGATDDGIPIHNRLTFDPKGGDPAEWPMDLRMREFPANA